MIVAVCGGDERQVRLARLLLGDGHCVRLLGLDRVGAPEGARCFEAAGAAIAGADCVILPLPAMGRRGYLNTPLAGRDYELAELFADAAPGQLFCGGMLRGETRLMAESAGVRLIDYYEREELLALNSAATAEGAIAELLTDTERILCRRRVLILGWGRIAKALAPRLAALGAIVTAAARKPGDLAWIRAQGYAAADIRALGGNLGGFELVINTVPALVLTAARLAELEPDTLILDLASKPGGTDFEAARAFGIRARLAPGLPGRWSPETAAEAVRLAVYNIIGELRT